jgi:hypothetical protein
MGGVNLGIGRIIIIIGLIVVGVVVLANGFSGSDVTAAPETESPVATGPTGPTGETGSDTGGGAGGSPTEAPPAVEPQEPVDVNVGVLNGTSVTGLAGEAQLTLEDAGYTISQEAADSPIKPIEKTILYFRGGANAAQNEVDAQTLSDGFFDGAPVRQLNEDFQTIVKPKTAVLVVLGEDQSSGG